jgi:hypothetical protein
MRLAIVATLALIVLPLAPREDRGEGPVARGRAALDDSYPWYDAPRDDIRRIEVTPTGRPWDFDWNGGGLRLPGLSWLAYAALTLLGLLLLWLMYVLIRAYLKRETQAAAEAGARQLTTATDASRIEALPFPLRRDAATDLLSAARQAYEQGRYGEAIIYLFSHQLVELDKHQHIRLTRGKTNRQYLRELSPRRPLQVLLEATMIAFEDVYFGSHPLDRQRFEACWARLGEFNHLIGAGT